MHVDPVSLLWVSTSRRRWLGLIVAVPMAGLSVGTFAGCSAPQDPAPDPSGSPDPGSGRTVQAEQQLADRAVAAARAGDQAAYRGVIGAGDPTFTITAERLWDNLAATDLDRLAITVSARREPLVPDRQNLLGVDAAATRATLGWRLAGQRRTVESEIWLTFTGAGDDLRWSGTTDHPTPTSSGARPVPVWWTEPVMVDHTDDVVVIRAASVASPAATSWAALATTAARQATRHLGARGRDRYVVEVPGTAAGFLAATGQPDAIGLAALTVPGGPDPKTAPALVVLNPKLLDPATPVPSPAPTTADSPADRLGLTLTHELVHAVLDAPARPAPLWIEEGTADAVAFAAYPALAEFELSRLAADLGDRTAQLPDDADFTPRATGLDQTYALAWTASRFIVEQQGGWTVLLRIGDQLADDPGLAWWRTLGPTSLAEFERAWGSWLRGQS